MNADRIRHLFLTFFKERGHRIVRSSSLIPADDPTLLFTNAGMNQFKDFFLGNSIPQYNRAVTCQKVMRAGGKHNDLENVGRTARHHTFFEMLGNFSFGDYFKEDAIRFAWDFLTVAAEIPPEKLAVSVFEKDDEAYDIWLNQIGVPKDKIARLGEKDNFWMMGDTGPCGPCSEIHYDLFGDNGKSPEQCLVDDDGRFLEIWNLVFMQFERSPNGTLTPLPKPSIDTGMGLERIASVLAHVKTNYDTSLFLPLLDDISRRAGYTFGTDPEKDVSCKVIADHIRALTFLIADGLIPGNDGRGYVMRRVLRRAARHAKHLQTPDGFLAATVPAVVHLMQGAYPELTETADYICRIIGGEESRFSGTLVQGMRHIERLIAETKAADKKAVSGAEIFKLYDTYGFPVDLANDVLEDAGLTYSLSEFDAELEQQRTNAREAQQGTRSNKKIMPVYQALQAKYADLRFSGYSATQTVSDAVCLIHNGAETDSVPAGSEFEIVLADTPFYAEGGGQIGDRGVIENESVRLNVDDTFKPFPGVHICRVRAVYSEEQVIRLSELRNLNASVNQGQRRRISAHHTATHLLHNALRYILGEHVKQAGSMVTGDRLRFDFSHYEPVGGDALKAVEEYANALVRENHSVETRETSVDEAVQSGALAFFGEKYGDTVRVVAAGPSVELCGGTHVTRTGDIAFIKVISEESVAAGVRRIEAVAAESAAQHILSQIQTLNETARIAGVKPDELSGKLLRLQDEIKEAQKTNQRLKSRIIRDALTGGKCTEALGSIRLTLYRCDTSDDVTVAAELMSKEFTRSHVGVAYSSDAGKMNLALCVSSDLTERFDAGKLVGQLAHHIGGRGGGKKQQARCGGNNPSGFDAFAKELKHTLNV